MAINPPSDIVSDVARAADPTRYQAAAQKLSQGASPIDGPGFDDAVRMASTRSVGIGGADVYAMRNSLRNDAETTSASKAKEAHQQFEAFVVQTFIESMMPKDAESTYGKGTAGSVWRSMMAEQMSAQISRAGGIGIANHLLKKNVPVGPTDATSSGHVSSADRSDQNRI